jgi:ankyrin repeat protein
MDISGFKQRIAKLGDQVSINEVDINGNTALHEAVSKGLLKYVI